MRKKVQTKGLCFSESSCFGVMKNQKIKKINRDPKKLWRFKNEGKPAFFDPNFSAATSHLRTKIIKSKLNPLKFKRKVVLYKNSVK